MILSDTLMFLEIDTPLHTCVSSKCEIPDVFAMILPDTRQFTEHRIITHLYQGKARIIGVFRFTSECQPEVSL